MDSEITLSLDRVQSYLKGFNKPLPDHLEELRHYGLSNQIPFIAPEVGELLALLCRIKTPQKILEIGFGSGFSAFWMASGCPQAKILSFEKNPQRFQTGLEIIQKSSYNIELLGMDVREYLKTNSTQFDFIFIDGVKSQYFEYLKLLEPWLNDGAIIVADNLFYRGLVVAQSLGSAKAKEIAKLKEFTQYISQSGNYETTLLPISDGVSVSIFKGLLN